MFRLINYCPLSDVTPMPDFFLEGTSSVHHSQYMITGITGQIPPSQMGQSAAQSSGAKEPAGASESGGGPIMEIMNKVQGLLSPEVVKSTNAVFQFDLKDKGTYYLDMKSGGGQVGQGTPPNKTDVTISVSGDDFMKLFKGTLSPTSAYMMGKMKIKGDMSKAMALDKLLGKLKSKL